MKRIIAIILTIIMILIFAGCNYNPVDVHWGFEYAYIYLPNGEFAEIKISSWTEDENSITIIAEGGQIFSVSYHNCILTKNRWEY